MLRQIEGRSPLESMPIDIHFELLSRLDMMTLVNVFFLNHFFADKVNRLSCERLKDYFPQQDQQKSFTFYHHAYRDYQTLDPRVMALFSFVKLGNLEQLKKMNLTFQDLCRADANGTPLLELAVIENHQHLLDYFYQEILQHLKEMKGYWEFICRQEGYEVKDLMNRQFYIIRDPDDKSKVKARSLLAILCAASLGHMTLVLKLAQHQMAPDVKNETFYFAVTDGRYNLVKNLLASNWVEDPLSFLDEEVLIKHRKMAILLLNSSRDAEQMNALLKAVSRSQKILLEYLLKQCSNQDNKQITEGKKNAFMHAFNLATSESSKDKLEIRFEIVKLFLKSKMSPDLIDYGTSLIEKAIMASHIGMLKLLLDYKANVNLVNPHTLEPPLYRMVSTYMFSFTARKMIPQQVLEMAILLLNKGANIDFKDHLDETVLTRLRNNKLGNDPLYQLLNCESQLLEVMKSLQNGLIKNWLGRLSHSADENAICKYANEKLITIKKKNPQFFEQRVCAIIENPSRFDEVTMARFYKLNIISTRMNNSVNTANAVNHYQLKR